LSEQKAEAKKTVKIRTEAMQPSHIVDCWRLYKHSLELAPPVYPSMAGETPELIRANLFQMLSAPNLVGFIAKNGKRPVGQIIGFITQRQFGSPRVYVQFAIFWVEPEYRKQGVAKLMLGDFFKKCRAMGVGHYESVTDIPLVEEFLKFAPGKAAVVSHRISGTIPWE
jgi:GNAT superfamily N-acetyltransferase